MHYNQWTGRPCHCPWGERRETWHFHAAEEPRELNPEGYGPEMRRLIKRPDKRLHSPEGWAFLRALGQKVVGPSAEDASLIDPQAYDALAPYLANRWKKGDVIHVNDDAGGRLAYYNHYAPREPYGEDTRYKWRELRANQLADWHQWYQARQHPTRRGVNVMDPNFTPAEFEDKVEQHREALEQQRQIEEELQHGRIEHKFPNGWHVRHLTAPGTDTDAALEGEGSAMSHCIGSDGQPYKDCARDGSIDVYSLRDPNGWPHGTWHTNSNGTVAEVFGHADRSLSPEQEKMYEEWCHANGTNPEPVGHEEGNGYDAEVQLPAADDVDSYLGIHGENGDRYSYIPDDANYGEDTEVTEQDPELGQVAADYFYRADPETASSWRPTLTQKKRREVFDTALMQGHLQDLTQELHGAADDETDQYHLQEWENWLSRYRHPLTGEFVQPGYNDDPIYDQFQRPLIEENYSGGPMERLPDGGWGHPLDPENSWTYNAKTAAPLYWRWAFDPQSGGVNFGHNETLPASDVEYHSDLATQPDMMHGYAYRLGGGWRLTDWDHGVVTDPYIFSSVIRALREHDFGKLP